MGIISRIFLLIGISLVLVALISTGFLFAAVGISSLIGLKSAFGIIEMEGITISWAITFALMGVAILALIALTIVLSLASKIKRQRA
ncbi:MAG: hypothetical protein HYW70_03525 [Candidatus Nealsonbacteria bacterium]|nr:hypothetical protein [Candidatus Nealsonbacteria bacterium]